MEAARFFRHSHFNASRPYHRRVSAPYIFVETNIRSTVRMRSVPHAETVYRKGIECDFPQSLPVAHSSASGPAGPFELELLHQFTISTAATLSTEHEVP